VRLKRLSDGTELAVTRAEAAQAAHNLLA
jgi:hypothetical protein